MTKRILMIITFIMLPAFFGCASTGVDYVKDAPERVKAADWAKMQIITVSLTEYKFVPLELVFKKDTPYKLVLKNDGKEKHYFVSEEFFRAIALRKVESKDGEVKAPYITAIEVYPDRSIDIYFIPAKAGTYDLICTVKGHAEKGMTGKIHIEEGKEDTQKGSSSPYY